MPGLTPSQTVGPFFHIGLVVPGGDRLADESTAGHLVTVEGGVVDGAGQPLPDALIELWDPSLEVFGRVATDAAGHFAFTTVMPGCVPGPHGSSQAPHLVIGVFARGLLTRLATRMYFDDAGADRGDAVLALVPAGRRGTLVARPIGTDRYRFDIVLQGKNETVFFDV
jgi:protocatechuate 3,4-dioxygenase alpha subunit